MSKEGDKQSKMTVESVKTDYPDIYQQVFDRGRAEGKKAVQDRFTRVCKLCEEHYDLAVDCFVKNMSDIEVMQAVKSKLERQLAEATSREVSDAIDPAVEEFVSEEKIDTTTDEVAEVKGKEG